MTMSIGGTTGLTFPDSSTQATAASGFGFKNRIINGDMSISQRWAGASSSASSQHTVDRWIYLNSQASMMTWGQNLGSVTPPTGFTNYMGFTTLTTTALGASDYCVFVQAIEGFNVADLGWGTANAQTVTLTFKVYSSLTGTFGGAFSNASRTRSYPFSYTISSANTWTSVTVTVPGDTSGTWLTNSGAGIHVWFSLGSGSNFAATAGSWGAGDKFTASGAVSVVSNASATWYITGVQLEVGSTATSFDYRPYGTELQLCQRYFEKSYNYEYALGSVTTQGCWVSVNINTGDFYDYGRCGFRVTKRATPTMYAWSPINGVQGQWGCFSIGANSGNVAADMVGMNGLRWYCNNSGMYGPNAAYGLHWCADAEI